MTRIATLALLLLASLPGCRSEHEPPRVLVLVSVDTLRADRLGAYGSERGLTPHLDALAAQSVVFDAAYAPSPFTLPSIAALLTGRYPESLGIASNASALPPAIPTLASTLRAAGWRTAAVVSNLVLNRDSGLQTGFDIYDETLPQREATRSWPERIAADTTDAALAILDDLRGRPDAKIFLWVHYQDPHGPYTPPPGWRERHLEADLAADQGSRVLPVRPGEAALGALPNYQVLGDERRVGFYRAGYHGEIEYTDEQVGRLLAGLDERGLDDEAIVIFTADHGEALGEEEYWFAHGEFLSEALVRVPLLIRRPGSPPDRRADPAALTDLFATVLATLGVGSDANTGSGRDLLAPDAAAGASSPYLATLAGGRSRRHGIVAGEYKYVLSLGNDGWQGRLFRRDGNAEAVELRDPIREASLRRRLAATQRGLRRREERRRPLDDAGREALRALGYVVGEDPAPAPPASDASAPTP
jgi:arylsulfatase